MKKIIVGSVLSLALITTAQASENQALGGIKQTVQVCLNVEGSANDGFSAGFVSSDFFDHTRHTATLRNGRNCVSHQYNHGPKNIKVSAVVARDDRGSFIKFEPDASCAFMKKVHDGHFESGYIRVVKPAETFDIKLTQLAPQDGYRYVYGMSCSLSSELS